MRVIIVGYGNQGKKRHAVAQGDVVGLVDVWEQGGWAADPIYYGSSVLDIPDDAYDAAIVCTPDTPKYHIVTQLLSKGKHVLVEKPLVTDKTGYEYLTYLAEQNKVVCYTAYNHRFEPHVESMKEVIDGHYEDDLGKLYLCRMFYGFGTAADVKGTWRDSGMGVLSEVGSHLIDLAMFWFGEEAFVWEAPIEPLPYTFENNAWDHFGFNLIGERVMVHAEASWISWKNTFTVDLYGENGSAHIDGLCKWGLSTFTLRKRILPSGRPTEISTIIIQPDNTWEWEYKEFKHKCEFYKPNDTKANLTKDEKIAKILGQLHAYPKGSQMVARWTTESR